MLRTSLRRALFDGCPTCHLFLSSNAQDFIEEPSDGPVTFGVDVFLSSNAQDFIEERTSRTGTTPISDIPEQ